MGDVVSKKCSKCGEMKPLLSYSKKVSGRLGCNARCKPCDNATQRQECLEHPERHRDHDLKKFYGITLGDYQRLLEDQDGKCAVCGTTKCSTGKRLGVDHCHETGKVRGILCKNCNTALGSLKDSPERIHRLGAYLENSRKEN